MTVDEKIFSEGIDTGDFVIKATAKIPIRKFVQEVPQSIVDDMEAKYSSTLDDLLGHIDRRLRVAEEASKSFKLVLSPRRGDDLFKAIGDKPKKPVDPTHAGTRGGKFWIDSKGRVQYGDKPAGDHREASDKEISDYARTHLTPTIFVGHTNESMQAFLDSGYFNENDLQVIEWFREAVLKSDDVLGNVEGYKDLDSIIADAGAQNRFKYKTKTGAEALTSWLEKVFYNNISIEDSEGKELSKNDKKQLFQGILQKYNDAHNDPRVLDALKENSARLLTEANNSAQSLKDTKKLTEVSGIFDRLITPKNLQDSALEAMILMRAQNLLFTVTSGKQLGHSKEGKTNKKLKGQIHVNDGLLNATTSSNATFKEAFKEATPAQMVAFAIAKQLSDHQDLDTGDYDPSAFKNLDGSLKNSLKTFGFGKELEETLAGHHKQNDLPKNLDKHYAQRISELGSEVLDFINKQHQGGDLSLELVMSGNAIKALQDPASIKALRAKMENAALEVEKLLKSQEDDSWEVPEGMKNGLYNGKNKASNGKVFDLFTHQKQAVNWMATAKRGILAHSAGMGKTLSVISFLESQKAKGNAKCQRGMMFLPPALIPQWIKEVKDYAPESKILNLADYPSGDRAEVLKALGPQSDYIFVSKGLLTGKKDETGAEIEGGEDLDNNLIESVKGISDAALMVDEVHQGGFKNPKNAAHQLTAKVLEDSEYAFGMTATPVPNSPEDLFNITNLFAPGSIGSLESWQGKLDGNQWNPETNSVEISNWEDLKAINVRTKPRVMVRKFDDPDVAKELAAWLPPAPVLNKDVSPMFLDTRKGSNGLSQHDYVTKACAHMAADRVEELNNLRITRGQEPYPETLHAMLKTLLMLNFQRQATISPKLIDPGYDGPNPKIEKCAEVINDHFKQGGFSGKDQKGITVFCNYKKSFPLLKKELAEKYGIDPSLIGEIHSDSQHDRGATQDAFNEGKLKIMLIGIKAGGAGLNLQKKANHMVFIDDPFTATDKEQAIGRVWRTGQKDKVMVTKLHVHDSYDERLNELVRDKGILAQALTTRNFDDINKDVTKKVELLGAKPAQKPTMEELEKFKHISETMKISDDDLMNLDFDKGGGNLDSLEYHVNEKVKHKLPAHMQSAHDMHEYEKKRKDKILEDQAGDKLEQYKQAEKYFKAQGKPGQADYYTGMIARTKALLHPTKDHEEEHQKTKLKLEAKSKGEPTPETTKPVKPEKNKPVSEEYAANITSGAKKAALEGLAQHTVLPTPKKGVEHPYKDSSAVHDASRDKAVGANEKHHLSGSDLAFMWNAYKKQKPKTAKDFMDKVLGGIDFNTKTKLTIVKQALEHFKKDGLV